ncbi:MAG TPA: hypothetical protein VGC18_02690 [Lacisediminihabitans sp.]|uniref:hypothetical protein n=1 Tax=Lacisediminihabitans sp. TaxID=2787631 RepID=UPI002ED9F75E
MASIPLQTSEHLVAVADQAVAAGFEVCWLLFTPPHTLSSASAEQNADLMAGHAMQTITDVDELEAHYAEKDPAAIFLQTPYPEHYPEWFWQSSKRDRMCFAGYGATLSTWEQGLYQLPTLHNCRWLLAESEFNRRKYIEHGNDPSRIVVAGNPLMFELRSRLSRAPATENTPTTLLWAPHWTSTWFENARGFSRWREAVGPLYDFFREHPAIRLLARPHPLLLEKFVEVSASDADPDDTDEGTLRSLLALGNVTLSTSTFVDDIIRSNALVTDGVSIIAYYSATGKPLAIMRDADSPPFNEVGEQLCTESDLQPDSASLARWLDEQSSDGFGTISPARRELSARVYVPTKNSPISIWAAAAGIAGTKG